MTAKKNKRRKPRETAVISEIDGIVKHGGIVKGQRKIIIVPDEAAPAISANDLVIE